MFASDVRVQVPDFGELSIDITYGGNYYAIVEPQGPYTGLDALGAGRLVDLSRQVRARVREQVEPVHPLEPSIRGVSHVLWADRPKTAGADARNAVFYRFIGRAEEALQLAGHPAIVPSIEGSAIATGFNTLWIDDADPFWRGFQVI